MNIYNLSKMSVLKLFVLIALISFKSQNAMEQQSSNGVPTLAELAAPKAAEQVVQKYIDDFVQQCGNDTETIKENIDQLSTYLSESSISDNLPNIHSPRAHNILQRKIASLINSAPARLLNIITQRSKLPQEHASKSFLEQSNFNNIDIRNLHNFDSINQLPQSQKITEHLREKHIGYATQELNPHTA